MAFSQNFQIYHNYAHTLGIYIYGDNNAARFLKYLLNIRNGNNLYNNGEVQIELSFTTSVIGKDKLIAIVYPQVA